MTRNEVPAVPHGMVRIANCGTYPAEHNADYTLLAEATGAVHGYPTVSLRHITRGYVIAGSAMRWDEARLSVTYSSVDGARHGRSFLEADEAAARTYFAKLTNPQAVSARRQEDAYLEDTVYAPARAERAAETAKRIAAEKARNAANRKARKAA